MGELSGEERTVGADEAKDMGIEKTSQEHKDVVESRHARDEEAKEEGQHCHEESAHRTTRNRAEEETDDDGEAEEALSRCEVRGCEVREKRYRRDEGDENSTDIRHDEACACGIAVKDEKRPDVDKEMKHVGMSEHVEEG